MEFVCVEKKVDEDSVVGGCWVVVVFWDFGSW